MNQVQVVFLPLFGLKAKYHECNAGNYVMFHFGQKKEFRGGLSEEKWLNLTYAYSIESEFPLCQERQYRDHHRRPSRL